MELKALRPADLPPKVRDRIEMVTLADAGWSAPRIAGHLGRHSQIVGDVLRSFLARGTAARGPCRSGPAPDLSRRQRVESALRDLLRKERTSASGQLDAT